VDTRSAPLAEPPLRCYIGPARLRRASGANISPGPYRSFRELSLAGSVDPDIWCPPTFVGNSGIACFNGVCGFALLFPRCFLSRASLEYRIVRWSLSSVARPRGPLADDAAGQG